MLHPAAHDGDGPSHWSGFGRLDENDCDPTQSMMLLTPAVAKLFSSRRGFMRPYNNQTVCPQTDSAASALQASFSLFPPLLDLYQRVVVLRRPGGFAL